MQFPHPQFLIDPQLVNMSTQMSSAHKHDFEDRIINKHQFCNYCKFDARYMLHNNCAPFLCEYCGYLRNYTHHSDQHLKTQPPMKRFTCNYCEFSTEYKPNLNRHYKRKHSTEVASASPGAPSSQPQPHTLDSQLTNMSSQEVTMEKISCPPKQKEIL